MESAQSDGDVELVRHNGQRGIELGRKDSVQVGGILYKGVMTITHPGQLSHQVFIVAESQADGGYADAFLAQRKIPIDPAQWECSVRHWPTRLTAGSRG